MKDLLLVIDMQKVYEEGAPWACRGVDRVSSAIRQLLDSGRAAQTIFTRYDASTEPVGCWAAYNEAYADINADSRLSELVDALAPIAENYPIFSKQTYSSLSIPELAKAVSEADRVLVTGVVAECCVLATVLALVDAGAKVVYLKDAVAGQTAEFEQMVETIVASFAPIHTCVMTVEEYLSSTDSSCK